MNSLAILLPLLAVAAILPAPAMTLYVSTRGSDSNSGRRASGPGPDGPLATPAAARDAIRRLRRHGWKAPVTVRFAAGVYELAEPLVLQPQDSGLADSPTTYEGAGAQKTIFSGGTRLKEASVQSGEWRLDVPGHPEEVNTLWAAEERRTLARTPNAGYFRVAATAPGAPGGGSQARRAFRFRAGDLKAWSDPERIRVVILHNWETSIHRIASVDLQQRVVTLTGDAVWPIEAGRRYYIENAPDALDAPGEWIYDPASGQIRAIPRPGDHPGRVQFVVPRLSQLLLLQGDGAHPVEHVQFRGIGFQHTGYVVPAGGHSDPQAAVSVNAVIEAAGARNCSWEQCEVAHTGNYGIWLRSGSQQNRIVQCELRDLGAGGVRIGETSTPASLGDAVSSNVVDNCFIHDGGRVYAGAVGVFVARSSYNTVSHCEICDLNYTGISAGWSWGYDPSTANHNVFEYNSIHDLGRGMLSDMGGIYTLGVSPGTIERSNILHDIYCDPAGYGGWGVYTDEGSSGILVENNLVYNTSSGDFHQHYGQNNVIENNIFAFGVTGILQRTREEAGSSFTFQHNLVLSSGTPFHVVGWSNGAYSIDNNLYWDYQNASPSFPGGKLADWQRAGRDRHSILADPRFVGVHPREPTAELHPSDFRLLEGSPALSVGFQPFPLDRAGLYGAPSWVRRAASVARVRYAPPPPPPPRTIQEDFESTAPGDRPSDAVVVEEGRGDSIRVTEETAASGKRSLKLTDAPNLEHRYNPHFYYSLDWREGVLQEDLDIRVEPGAEIYHEWRDSASPYHVGPHFRIDGGGRLTSGSRELATIPLSQWVRVKMVCGLGKRAVGAFDLELVLPGKTPPLIFRQLPCDHDFRSLNWFGFSMDRDGPGVAYLDNLHLRPASK